MFNSSWSRMVRCFQNSRFFDLEKLTLTVFSRYNSWWSDKQTLLVQSDGKRTESKVCCLSSLWINNGQCRRSNHGICCLYNFGFSGRWAKTSWNISRRSTRRVHSRVEPKNPGSSQPSSIKSNRTAGGCVSQARYARSETASFEESAFGLQGQMPPAWR